ncbi:MAG: DUF3307 domain-containing protein [Elusimicrobiota bacterium]|jgi:hypothetical protein|nr:DUF3307 domain-containing protein [Elusimicrobiota bacterium]
MILFLRLLLAHFLADFVFHGDILFRLKEKSKYKGYGLHAIVYFLCLLVLCWPYLNMHWFNLGPLAFNGWFSIILLVAAHIAVDNMNSGDDNGYERGNFITFLLWQIVAILFLFFIAPIMPPLPSDQVFLNNENFLIGLNGAFFVTTFFVIFLYLLEKSLSGENALLFEAKYLGIAYRLALYLLLLIPSFIGYILAAVWVGVICFLKHPRSFSELSLRFTLGTVFTVVVAIFVRFLVY